MKSRCLLAVYLANTASADVSIGHYSGSNVTLLAIDSQDLPLADHLRYYITKPKARPEPVLVPSRGDPRAADSAAATRDARNAAFPSDPGLRCAERGLDAIERR